LGRRRRLTLALFLRTIRSIRAVLAKAPRAERESRMTAWTDGSVAMLQEANLRLGVRVTGYERGVGVVHRHEARVLAMEGQLVMLC
jgi:hypothetical protein